MKPRTALARGGFAAAACAACCAPPIIAALGVTAGLAATAGIFLGLGVVLAVLVAGGAWIVARARRSPTCASDPDAGRTTSSVPVAAPVRRELS